MSTRATYLFTNGRMNKEVCIYIHYDGYPQGAARYFRQMLAVQNKRGGFPCQFIRGNNLAEITKGHEFHGDTEYRYTLNSDGTLKAEARKGFTNEWDCFFNNHFSGFINHHDTDGGPAIVPVESNFVGFTEHMDLVIAMKKITDGLSGAIEAASQGGWSANNQGRFSDAFAGFASVARFLAENKHVKVEEQEQVMMATLESIVVAAETVCKQVNEEKRVFYYGRTKEELEAICTERGLPLPPMVTFGDARCNLWNTLTADDYATAFAKK